MAPRPGRGARKRAQRAAVRVALASREESEASARGVGSRGCRFSRCLRPDGPLSALRLPVGVMSLSPPLCQPLSRPSVLCSPSNRFFSLVRLGEPRLDADRRRLVRASSSGKEWGALELGGGLPPRQTGRQTVGAPAYLAPGATVGSRGFCVCSPS